jgi:hypothetical protein
VLAPVDPQNWENPDSMTWDDLKKVPDIDWSDPNRKGTVRTMKAALVLGDYPNEQFAIIRPQNSDIYANPRSNLQLDRSQVPAFYRDFLNKPQPLNPRRVRRVPAARQEARVRLQRVGPGRRQLPDR